MIARVGAITGLGVSLTTIVAVPIGLISIMLSDPSDPTIPTTADYSVLAAVILVALLLALVSGTLWAIGGRDEP